MKRALIYARSAVITCITGQLELCRGYAQARGLHLIGAVLDYSSGLKKDRPLLARALEMGRQGEYEVLIAADPNRLSRDAAHLFQITQDLEQAGLKWEFVSPPYLTVVAPSRSLPIVEPGSDCD